MRPLALLAALSAAGAACTGGSNLTPGDEGMGTFDFTTQLSEQAPFADCALAEVPRTDFTFQGAFSRQRETGEAWFVIGGVPHPGSFDGQVVATQLDEPRQFPECGSATVRESLTVALLSRSQDSALGGCPAAPLDGGVPVDPDAGIFPPNTTSTGFDALRACGELLDEVLPDQTCDGGTPSPTQPCMLRYPVMGVRR